MVKSKLAVENLDKDFYVVYSYTYNTSYGRLKRNDQVRLLQTDS